MALSYCEVCGVLIKGEGKQDLPEGVICDDCFDSRQADVPAESDAVEVAQRDIVQFECIYCKSVLRLKIVLGQRTHIRCPKCGETFYLREDGSVEARLEGNTTAILVRDEDDQLRDLTPGLGQTAALNKTQPISGNKTQPLPRGVSSLLDGSDLRLIPESDEGPLTSKAAEQMFSTGAAPQPQADASDAGGSEPLSPALAALQDDIELMPAQEGAGGRITAKRRALKNAELRASDEGRLDLGAEELKRKTSRLTKDEIEARRSKQKVPTKGKQKVPTKGKQKVASKGKQAASGKGAKSDRLKAAGARLSASQRLKKRQAAVEQGQAIAIESERRALVTMALWALMIVPFLLALGLVQLSERSAPLVDPSRGLGQALERGGLAADHGVRALNALLPPPAKVPGVTDERPGAPAHDVPK